MINESILDRLSFKSSIGKSLRKIRMTDLTEYDKQKLVKDLNEYRRYLIEKTNINELGVAVRIKSTDSFKLKIERYKNTDRSLFSVVNDLLNIRIITEEYSCFEDALYLRKVDMTQGKSVDDGYRAIHYYYCKDNQHYPIEIQIWSEIDSIFNTWTHKYSYKFEKSDIGKVLRRAYDSGIITSEKEFKQALELLRKDEKL